MHYDNINHNMRHRNNKFLAILLLAFVLSAQWLFLTHVHDEEKASADSLCSICLVGEHFDHATLNTTFGLQNLSLSFIEIKYDAPSQVASTLVAFHSRAPPISL